jgi:hypothetical protein
MRTKLKWLWLIPLALILMVGVYFLPPVHDRLAWRVDELRTQIKYFFNPPDQAVFQPSQQFNFDDILATTRAEYMLTLTPQAQAATGTPVPTRPGPTLTPTLTPTPGPASVTLSGVKYESQSDHNNYCGPTNFAMALTFWGWKGSRSIIGDVVMPGNSWGKDGKAGNKDKNVMPYEFQDYIAANVPGMTSALRYGGDIDVLKRLIAGGFPVIAEKGYYEQDTLGKVGWMGHYQFITGYNDADATFLIQDTYKDGPNFKVPYAKFMEGWRNFNYIFVVVYPTSREADVTSLLGLYSDASWATQHALDVAVTESQNLTGIDRFYAWFNVGTSRVALQEYVDAAVAYDEAFSIYANLDPATRPYRMMWYQTGPYFAYFYSARYTDVIQLANTTLNPRLYPDLEESLLWRGRAYYMIGQTALTIADYRAALNVHPKWGPAIQALQDIGVQP